MKLRVKRRPRADRHGDRSHRRRQHRPAVTIDRRAAGATYRDGVTVTLAGSATTPRTASCPPPRSTGPSSLSHNVHNHPIIDSSGVSTGLVSTSQDDHDADSPLRDHAHRDSTSSGSGGSSTTISNPVQKTTAMTLDSQPAGAPLTYAWSERQRAVHGGSSAIGFRTSISAADLLREAYSVTPWEGSTMVRQRRTVTIISRSASSLVQRGPVGRSTRTSGLPPNTLARGRLGVRRNLRLALSTYGIRPRKQRHAQRRHADRTGSQRLRTLVSTARMTFARRSPTVFVAGPDDLDARWKLGQPWLVVTNWWDGDPQGVLSRQPRVLALRRRPVTGGVGGVPAFFVDRWSQPRRLPPLCPRTRGRTPLRPGTAASWKLLRRRRGRGSTERRSPTPINVSSGLVEASAATRSGASGSTVKIG